MLNTQALVHLSALGIVLHTRTGCGILCSLSLVQKVDQEHCPIGPIAALYVDASENAFMCAKQLENGVD